VKEDEGNRDLEGYGDAVAYLACIRDSGGLQDNEEIYLDVLDDGLRRIRGRGTILKKLWKVDFEGWEKYLQDLDGGQNIFDDKTTPGENVEKV